LVSKGGGTAAHWRGDGMELFHDAAAPDLSVMAVEVSTNEVFRSGVLSCRTLPIWRIARHIPFSKLRKVAVLGRE
jgi:hypothetical protein